MIHKFMLVTTKTLLMNLLLDLIWLFNEYMTIQLGMGSALMHLISCDYFDSTLNGINLELVVDRVIKD